MATQYGKWIYSPEYQRYYRDDWVNGAYVRIWEENTQSSQARPDSGTFSNASTSTSPIQTYAPLDPTTPRYDPNSSQNAQNVGYAQPSNLTRQSSNQYSENQQQNTQYNNNQYGDVSYTSASPGVSKGEAQGSPTRQRHQHSLSSSSAYQVASSLTQHQPQTSRQGAPVQGTYYEGTLHYETLDHTYFVRPRSFFTPGRMFSILFTEPAGSTATTTYNDSISVVKFGEHAFTQIRRFIVVRAKVEFCFACPVFTYSGQATLKRGVRPEEHAIVYTRGYYPQLLAGESGIVKDPIMVDPASDATGPLDRCSRIYFGIHHPIQYNVKVKDMGMVCADDIQKVIGYWQEEQLQATQHFSRDATNPYPSSSA